MSHSYAHLGPISALDGAREICSQILAVGEHP